MIKPDIFMGLVPAFARQSLVLYGDEISLNDYDDAVRIAKEKYRYCLSRKKVKHQPEKIHQHADEYCSFLVFLAREAYIRGYHDLARAAYLVNRRLHSFDCFYTREMPELFHLENPVGSVLGQATFGNYLVVYQGVSVGGDLKLRYPTLGEGVALLANSSVIGGATIGSNSAIGAGVMIYGKSIPDGSAISFRSTSGYISSSMSWTVKERFFN